MTPTLSFVAVYSSGSVHCVFQGKGQNEALDEGNEEKI